MPPKTEQEVIKEILNYLVEKPNIKDRYLKFLEDSKNYYYSSPVLLDALSFIKQKRFANFSKEESALIRLTRLFVKTAYPLQPEFYQESQFSVDALIKEIKESSPSNSPTNPGSEARMSEVGRCLIS